MRSLACQCAQLWVKTQETLGHPLGICSEVNHVDHPKTIKEQVEKVGVNPREFVLEIGTEEMPPGDVIDASEQILDPILPGQEFPLPLHLAEAGRIRWRTAGTCYVWSETHSLSNILAQGNKPGFPKSFVCYHSNPNSDPFWCCMSVHSISLRPAYGGKDSHLNRSNGGSAVEAGSHRIQNPDLRKMRFIRQVRLASPFLVKNYLPLGLSLKVDCGGVAHPVSVSKEDTASLFYVDSTHDLGITFNMQGFGPTVSKFPRAESFIAISKSNGSKFISSEILTFNSDTADDM
ncbi:Glycine--tRNA ligase protein [Dioscorea alata]|uniref:Glycine--tRNA ligase protein n=1 Tax=Dioscorea alata TaxID=55571 RepID=A0ACB7V4K6_DIOAL|nr:Glycine--tRNA ligase protein [Dioscorea alata]